MNKKLPNLKLILIILISAGILSACSKKTETPSNQLIGTWTISSATADITVNGKSLTQYYTDLGSTQTEAAQLAQIIESSIQQSFTGTVTVKSDNTYTATISGSTDSGTWSLNSDGTKLTLVDSNNVSSTYDIVNLDSHNLELSFVTTEQDDLNSDGTPDTITLNVNMKLTK